MRGNRPGIYQASATLQIRNNTVVLNTLAIHEDRGDGTPVCGTLNRDWNGKPMHYVQLGSGTVTCKGCARAH